MLAEYRQVLQGLYERQRVLEQKAAGDRRRLRILEEEIDEMEEAVMRLRPYAAREA